MSSSGVDSAPAMASFEIKAGEEGEQAGEGPKPITTVSDAVDYMEFGRFQWLLLFYAGCAWIADACEIMLLSYLALAAECAFELSSGQVSALSSIVFVGIMLGAWLWAPLADWRGRKLGFMATALFTCVFAVLSATAVNYAMLVTFRFFCGFGLGGISIVFNLFMEFVPTKRRGVAMISMQMFWTVGTFLQVLLISVTLPTLGWRWMVGLSAFPSFVILLGYWFVPESPQWLLRVKGDADAAEQVLQRVARVSKRPLPPLALRVADTPPLQTAASGREPAALLDDVAAAEGGGVVESSAPVTGAGAGAAPRKRSAREQLKAMSMLIRMPLLPVTLCMILIWFVNAFVYYGLVLLTTKISASDGGDEDGPPETECVDGAPIIDVSSYIEVAVVTTAEFPGLLLAAGLVDLLGRKKTLGFGLATCGVAILVLLAHPPAVVRVALLWVSRALIMGTFSVGWLFTPEAYPTHIRSTGVGLCNGFARLGGIVAPFFSNSLFDAGLLWVTLVTFGSAALTAAAASFLIPIGETAGLQL